MNIGKAIDGFINFLKTLSFFILGGIIMTIVIRSCEEPTGDISKINLDNPIHRAFRTESRAPWLPNVKKTVAGKSVDGKRVIIKKEEFFFAVSNPVGPYLTGSEVKVDEVCFWNGPSWESCHLEIVP